MKPHHRTRRLLNVLAGVVLSTLAALAGLGYVVLLPTVIGIVLLAVLFEALAHAARPGSRAVKRGNQGRPAAAY